MRVARRARLEDPMTPTFWILVGILARLRAALPALRTRLARWRVRAARALRLRRRARVVVVADEYLREYTGLTRADLEQAFRDPVWSRRSAGLERGNATRRRAERATARLPARDARASAPPACTCR